HLQPHVGADVPLFKALLKGVVEAGGVDGDFVAAHTSGWEAVEADLAATPWDALLDASGVARSEIARAVAMLVRARRGVLLWAMGLTHHVHGVDNVLALANLALARGWLGRPGSGLLPIRGHSNVQGVGSVGVTPQLKAAFAARMEEVYGIPTARTAGLDTYASMAAAAEGRMRAAVLLGGNLFASNPDRMWAAAALRRLALTVSITTKLNEGHVHGRGQTAVILPVLARDEESQCTTQESMFNFVRLSEGGEPAVDGDLRSEVEVIAALAELILPPGRFDWFAFRSHERLRQEMAKMVPGYGAIGDIDRTRREFHVAGRVLHAPPFPTGDGRAHFHVTPLPAFAPPPGEFRLMTLRSEGQFNTVVYEEEDLYRGNRHRDVVMMAAEDAARLGLGEGDPVVAAGPHGGVFLAQACGVSLALVAQRVELRGDHQRRRQPAEARGAQGGRVRIPAVLVARRVVVPEPDHVRTGEEVSLGVLPARARLEVGVGGRIDQELVDDVRAAAVAGHERDDRREIAARAVPADGNAPAIRTERGRVLGHPSRRRG